MGVVVSYDTLLRRDDPAVFVGRHALCGGRGHPAAAAPFTDARHPDGARLARRLRYGAAAILRNLRAHHDRRDGHPVVDIAALLLAIEPLRFCLLGWPFFNGKKPEPRHYIGITAGFAGVCILIAGDPNANLSLRAGCTFWMLLVVAASMTWGVGAFISKTPGIHHDPLTVSGMQMICGGAQMMLLQLAVSSYAGEYHDL